MPESKLSSIINKAGGSSSSKAKAAPPKKAKAKKTSEPKEEAVKPEPKPQPPPTPKPEPAPPAAPVDPKTLLLREIAEAGEFPVSDGVKGGMPGNQSLEDACYCHTTLGRTYFVRDGIAYRTGGLDQSIKRQRKVDGQWEDSDGLYWYRETEKGRKNVGPVTF